VRLKEGRPAGARQHLFTAEAGEALFGIDPAGSGGDVGLLAVGTPGTQALRCERIWLGAHALAAQEGGSAVGLLECWVDRLSAALSDEMPPRQYRPLAVPGEAVLQGGEMAQTVESLGWVTIDGGRALFDGLDGLELTPRDGFFPLSRHAWLRAVAPTRLTSRDTAGVLADGLLEAGLQRFQTLALTRLSLRLAAAAAAAAERLERLVAADQLAVEHGIAALVSAYEPRRAVDALLAAGLMPSTCSPIARTVPAKPET